MLAFVHVPKTGGASIRNMIPAADFGHATLGEILKDKRRTRDDFLFSVVRNPWERLHSWYRHERWYDKMDFEQYVLEECYDEVFMKGYRKTQLNVYDQYQWIRHEDVKLDYVLRFEQLQDDMDRMMNILEKPRQKLPHLHNAPSKTEVPYSPELWTHAMLVEVAEFFEPFSEEYGYNDLGGDGAPLSR